MKEHEASKSRTLQLGPSTTLASALCPSDGARPRLRRLTGLPGRSRRRQAPARHEAEDVMGPVLCDQSSAARGSTRFQAPCSGCRMGKVRTHWGSLGTTALLTTCHRRTNRRCRLVKLSP